MIGCIPGYKWFTDPELQNRTNRRFCSVDTINGYFPGTRRGTIHIYNRNDPVSRRQFVVTIIKQYYIKLLVIVNVPNLKLNRLGTNEYGCICIIIEESDFKISGIGYSTGKSLLNPYSKGGPGG